MAELGESLGGAPKMRVLRRLKSAVIFAFPIVAFLLLLCPSAAVQEASKDAAPKSSNAMAFLTEVFELYGQSTPIILNSAKRELSVASSAGLGLSR